MVINNRGFSLVEILIAVGLLSLGTTFFLQQTSSQHTLLKNESLLNLLDGIVEQNTFFLKGEQSTEYPSHGTCIKKTYNLKAEFKGEIVVSKCETDFNPSKDEVVIFLDFKKYADIVATFTPEDTLKLPKYNKNVYQIDITGFISGVNRTFKREVSLFKR